MQTKFSPSVNIIRDAQQEFKYLVTPNAERVVEQINNDYLKGIHAFTLIGSYGTGKSSFLLALEQTITQRENYFNVRFPLGKKTSFIRFVGEYNSLIKSFADYFNIDKVLPGNQNILDQVYQELEKSDGLVLILDEFGKFLEYASKNNPEQELYFIQQLAEFVNHPDRNILLITTLHQSFESYSLGFSESERNEWTKVKGRLMEITFNEPAEQLLLLASKHLSSSITRNDKVVSSVKKLVKKYNLFKTNLEFIEHITEDIYPIDPFAGYCLTLALQKYGQNERSLFTFLETSEELLDNTPYNLPKVYDYLMYNHYSFLTTKHNPDYVQWNNIRDSIDKAESEFDTNTEELTAIIKTVGLLNLFARKGTSIDEGFLVEYGINCLEIKDVSSLLKRLSDTGYLRYSKYLNRYRLYEGTDLDIESALIEVSNKVEEVENVVPKLKEHFDHQALQAKAYSYITGTSRFFDFEISEEPLVNLVPEGELDGYINLVFSEFLSEQDVLAKSKNVDEAILFGYYHQSQKIKDLLKEINKTQKVKKENENDKVAKKQLENILEHQEVLLSHYLKDSFYTNQVSWIYKGQKSQVSNKKELNKLLSKICEDVYTDTPVFNNELVNRHKISPSIHTARKLFFESLVNDWDKEDLGFPKDKFPPEKTIYLTFLQENGIHTSRDGEFYLERPPENSTFSRAWEVCENFMESTKEGRKKVQELVDTLSQKPLKLKQGLIDFLVPTFLFVKREDYALFGSTGYIPSINIETINLLIRNTGEYEVKAFNVAGVKLELFNKYRELLQQKTNKKATTNSFIETIKPFLVFHRDLTDYSKTTNRLSKEALSLRVAIEKSEDPEKTFFNDFPKALNVDLDRLNNSREELEVFTKKLKSCIEEINSAYDGLLTRIEEFITSEILSKKLSFKEYKSALQHRYKNLKEHLLLPHQKVFLARINTGLNDKNSWLASVGQGVIGKRLTQIKDDEELKLYDRFKQLINELDNLSEIYQLEVNSEVEEVVKLDITTLDKGTVSNVLRIPKEKFEEVSKLKSQIASSLGKDKKLNLAILMKLINEQLEND